MSNPSPHQADLAARFRNPRFIQVHFESPGIWRFICESLDRGTVRVLLNDDGQIIVMHADILGVARDGRPGGDDGPPRPRRFDASI